MDRLCGEDGQKNHHPQDKQRSAVLHLASAAPCARCDCKQGLARGPTVNQYLPKESDLQNASIFQRKAGISCRLCRKGIAIAAIEVPELRQIRCLPLKA